MTDESWKSYSTTLRRLLEVPGLRRKFQQDLDGTATGNLKISPEMRNDLKALLLILSEHGSEPSVGETRRRWSRRASRPRARPQATTQDGEDRFATGAIFTEEFFEHTYRQIRRGALATTTMSILIFVTGLFLLGVAVNQSITRQDASTAVALAASGIVAIAAAFYRSPVTEIRKSATEMQRSNMVLMSYILGLNLLSRSLSGQQTDEQSTMLTNLTRELASLLHGTVKHNNAKDGERVE